MASLFSKDPATEDPPSVYDKIADEIAHLKKKTSIRDDPNRHRKALPWVGFLVIFTLLGLYIMDPFFYGMHKSDAIRVYLYLHSFDSDASIKPLVASRILSEDEVLILSQREGSFQDYYTSSQEAEQKADVIVQYMNGLKTLHNGPYEKLDWLGKIRYQLFVRTGIPPPISWTFLTPTVQ